MRLIDLWFYAIGTTIAQIYFVIETDKRYILQNLNGSVM
jgi:hypothetical protein